jgi:hypothetical protein
MSFHHVYVSPSESEYPEVFACKLHFTSDYKRDRCDGCDNADRRFKDRVTAEAYAERVAPDFD